MRPDDKPSATTRSLSSDRFEPSNTTVSAFSAIVMALGIGFFANAAVTSAAASSDVAPGTPEVAQKTSTAATDPS